MILQYWNQQGIIILVENYLLNSILKQPTP
jgi:hypothetical protein